MDPWVPKGGGVGWKRSAAGEERAQSQPEGKKLENGDFKRSEIAIEVAQSEDMKYVRGATPPQALRVHWEKFAGPKWARMHTCV